MKFNLSIILLCMGLIGCSSTVDYRGKQPEFSDIEKIKVNHHNKEDVLTIIGSPTSTNLYGPTKWFYVFKKTESTSFLDPKIVAENIVTLSFDDAGRVINIESSDDVEHTITPIKHQTPTQGSNATIFQQVFGNFGRHIKNADSDKT